MLLEKNEIKENSLNEIKKEWLAANNSFPAFLTEISSETKQENEQYIQSVSDKFKEQLNHFSHIPLGRKKWKQKTFSMLEDILNSETIISLHRSMDPPTLVAFQEELKEFLRHVRQFSPELSIAGIGQAIRNYIVYAMFNELNLIKSDFSIAGFGYSMLYPFTDNYIDSINYTDIEKAEYNQIIRDKIEGKEVHPKTIHQRKTCELLQAIESEYPRDNNPTIFTLLLMMLEAQEDSIRQQKKSTNHQSTSHDMDKNFILSVEERLDISIYKGGISVLIDRFLVKKEVTKEDLLFYLGFGFFLQLADDLQDIKEDSLQGSQTIFTVDLRCEQEEIIVNKMLHFVHKITNSYQAENEVFKNFILSTCYQLIYSAVVGSKEFFSQEYLVKIEKYLPITYIFLENIKNNQIKNKKIKVQNKNMKILDAMIF